MLEIKKIKTTDLVLEIPIQKEVIENESLQRNDDWHIARNGGWTGSKNKNIMACGKSTSRLEWGNDDKINGFSTGVIKLIYEKAMQRKTGNYTMTAETTQMKYGTRVEPLINAIASEMLGVEIKEVGYKPFDDIPTAGASSDGVVENGLGITEFVVEHKACTSWSTHYDRTFEITDVSSVDFWQTQTEMRAWNVEKCYYFVASPPKDIMKYVYYDGDIMDLLEDFKKECTVNIEIIEASPIHIDCLVKRIKICETVCNLWIKNGGDLRKIFYSVLDGTMGYVKAIDIEEPIIKDFDFDDLPF